MRATNILIFMNTFFKFFSFVVLSLALFSCSKSDSTAAISLRDYRQQYLADSTAIDAFFKTHAYSVDANSNVTFAVTTNPALSMRKELHAILRDTSIVQDGITYDKVYFLKLNAGTQRRPTPVDSIFIAYKGTFISQTGTDYNETQFDASPNPIWLPLQGVISGWQHILPYFKTGTYTSGGSNPTVFSGFGTGVMFLPSGLAYFGGSVSTIPVYSPLIFTFKMYELQYRDHDRDGILSKDERALGTDPLTNWTINPMGYDTDGDGVFNMFDVDDDGDFFTTKFETRKPAFDVTTPTNPSGSGPSLYYPFNPTATETKGVPSKPVGTVSDFTSPNRLRVYLDPTYHPTNL